MIETRFEEAAMLRRGLQNIAKPMRVSVNVNPFTCLGGTAVGDGDS